MKDTSKYILTQACTVLVYDYVRYKHDNFHYSIFLFMLLQ